jgi:hypothetical protein
MHDTCLGLYKAKLVEERRKIICSHQKLHLQKSCGLVHNANASQQVDGPRLNLLRERQSAHVNGVVERKDLHTVRITSAPWCTSVIGASRPVWFQRAACGATGSTPEGDTGEATVHISPSSLDKFISFLQKFVLDWEEGDEVGLEQDQRLKVGLVPNAKFYKADELLVRVVVDERHQKVEIYVCLKRFADIYRISPAWL